MSCHKRSASSGSIMIVNDIPIKPDFSKINIMNCAIISLKNQLKMSKSIDELTLITSKIITLEESIANERLLGYRKLNQKRKDLEMLLKINNSKSTECELEHITAMLKYKINGYKSILDNRINTLSNEYSKIETIL
jgi:hypothetical protein